MSHIEVLPIKIRPLTQLDVSFVFSSWLKSFKGAFFAKDIHPKTYFSEQHRVVASLLSTCQTYVACAESDPTEIFGFICGEYMSGAFVLHYIYVKHTFRNLGIARQLLGQFKVGDVSFYSHHNAVAHKQAAAYHFLYNPYLALSTEYRKDKPKNDLDLTEKVKEQESDESKFKRQWNRGSTPKRPESGSPKSGESSED